ncbi:hypothetical protein F5Y11DRAFT_346925 [Daldinia sp. FL1419]|nr:hypothetical protein F5Y11DRAFT_346925 [Daldinia sp. FL1419]
MSPTIDIFRHAVARSNVYGSYMRDPGLTFEGRKQCLQIRQTYGFGHLVTHLIASPLRRSIETALYGLVPLLIPSKRVSLHAELQEIAATPSSTGVPKSQLEKSFSHEQVITKGIEEDWYVKGTGSAFAPDVAKVRARAREMRNLLFNLAKASIDSGDEDAHLVVVTHGEFAHWLVNDFQGVNAYQFTDWDNAEMRSYKIKDMNIPILGDPELVETTYSTMCRGIFTPIIPDDECERIAVERVVRHAERLESVESLQQELPDYETTDESDSDWADVDK